MEKTIRRGLLAAVAACAFGLAFQSQAEAASGTNCGGASWYALHSRTASGERMNPALMTAAHKKLRFGTRIKVTNMRNGKSVVVRVNDRGPFVRGRVLDLSKGAAAEINMIRSGTAKVCYEIIR